MDDLRVLKALRRLVRGCNLAQGVKGIIADESGAIALIMAFALTAFLGIGALTVDYGYMSSVQGELKKAAEAGALAGANALGKNADWNAAATSIIQENQAAGQLLTDCQVLSGYWSVVQGKFFGADPKETPSAVQAVQVVVAKTAGNNGGPLPLSFAPILGINNANLSGTAVAIVKTTSGTWSILKTSNDTGTVTISGAAIVNNSVGVNGGGKLIMGGSASVKGKIYLNTSAKSSFGGGTSRPGGLQQDSAANDIITAAVNSATNFYDNCKFQPATKVEYPDTINFKNAYVSKKPIYYGEAKQNVMVLTDLILKSDSEFTLDAPAAGSFVIVVKNAMDLSGSTKILLTGGLTAENVTYIFTGNSMISITAGSTFNGNILSLNGGAINLAGGATYNGVLVSNNTGTQAIRVANGVKSLQPTWLPGPGGSGNGAALVQ
jgi:Flp pilus assembly protein TadG